MSSQSDWYLNTPLPALLRAARRTCGSALRAALAEAGFDDIPRNGIYVIGAIARNSAPLSQIISALGVSKQSAGQVVDTLVLRGYLDRRADEEDRRRLTVTLTKRGAAAAAISRTVVNQIEDELINRIGSKAVTQTRKTLAALVLIGHDELESTD